MRILLTGKSGQLGRELETRLDNRGEIFAPLRREFDLCAPDKMRRSLDRFAPDLIVNAAAYTAVDQAESDIELATQVNAQAPAVMAEWAAANGSAILHYSTDYVFDGTGTAPYQENDAVSPINRYGETKRAGEVAVINSGAAHLIIRTSWIYDTVGSNFLRTILRLAKERTDLKIVDDQIGAPTPAWWLAQATAEILSPMGAGNLFVGKKGGILNAAAAGSTSWYGFATAIIEGARKRSVPLNVQTVEPIPAADYPTPAARPAYSVFSLEKLRTEFAVNPPPWHEALEPVLDQIAQRSEFR